MSGTVSVNRQATYDLAIMADDLNGLARAMDIIIDEDGRPGMQAILNAMLERSKQLQDAIEDACFMPPGRQA